jgi:hypothetical protein
MKTKTKEEWISIALWCDVARGTAPPFSPMRLFFLLGAKYARRRARRTNI